MRRWTYRVVHRNVTGYYIAEYSVIESLAIIAVTIAGIVGLCLWMLHKYPN